MLVDYHNHTSYCNHAIGPMSYYLAEAERLELTEFGFSEHCPWMMGVDGHPLCPSLDAWKHYVSEVEGFQEDLRARGSKLILRFGVELDYTPGIEPKAEEFIKRHPFDYVLGSVHYVTGGRDAKGTFTLARARNVRHLYELYFGEVKKLVSSGLIDILGHLDLPKRDGDVPPGGYLDLVQDLIGTLAKHKVTVEINTSGRDKPIREFFPSPEAVNLLVRSGIPITLGSDSHSPSDVGRYLGEAVQLLRDCGAKEIMTFNKRKRIPRKF